MTIAGKCFSLGACLVLASCTHSQSGPADRRIPVGSHHLEMHTEGEGTPVVVIETGVTDPMENWRPLQQRLAQVTQVVAYNRAGYGKSEPGPLPRDAAREAEELKTLMEAAKIPGPYVLVGHSLGGLNVQAFAARYPGLVAGMVLLDPPPLSFILGQEYAELGAMAEQMTAEWQAIADGAAQAADPQEKARGDFFRMIASEHREMFGESARETAAVETFGDIPLVVIAAGQPNPAFGAIAGDYQQYWIEQSRRLAGKSTAGRFVLAEGASHYLYRDAPDLVAESILSVVKRVK